MASFEYYKPFNKNFDKNGDIRIQMLDGSLNLQLNTSNEVDIEIAYDRLNLWKKIERFGVIKLEVPYVKNKQLYRIYDLEKDMLSFKIKARHIFYDMTDNILLDNRPTNCSLQDALNNILADTSYKGQSDITICKTAYYINKNCVQAICGDIDNSMLKVWGGELFQDNFNVIINKKIGGDYGVKIKYSLNMQNVTLDDNADAIYTRLYPQAYDGVMLPEKYVDSPYLNNYPILKCNFVSMEDLKLKDDKTTEADIEKDVNSTYFDTEEELYEAMRNRCKQLFDAGLDRPCLSGTVDMIALEDTIEYKDFKELVNVSLGDTVTVEYKDIDIFVKTRCMGYEYNLVDKKYSKIQLDKLQENYFDSQSDISKQLNSISSQLSNTLTNDSTIKAENVRGIIDATKAQMQVIRNVATDSPVKALLFEDKVKGSKTYGAMALGTMGFMIANQRTPDDKDWDWKTFGTGAGFVADMITSGKINTNEIDISSTDNTLKLSGNALELFNNNGQKTASFQDFGLNIYDCFDAGSFVGGLQSVEDTSNNKLKALQLYVDNMGDKANNYVALGNKYKIESDGSDRFHSSLEVHNDHINIQNKTRFVGTSLEFVDSSYNYIGGVNFFDDDTIGFCTNWNKEMQLCYENNGEYTPALTMLRDRNPRWEMWGGLQLKGDLTVTGSKNRLVKTEHYGNLKMNAYETTECWFADIGEVTLDENGYCKVYLDDKFKETIDINSKYHVFLTKYGAGDVYVAERNVDYFVIKGTKNLTVAYEIKAKQKDYANIRLEEFKKEGSVENGSKKL